MPGTLRAPEHVKREIMRADAVQPWTEPACEICLTAFGTSTCQNGKIGQLRIVEEFDLDGSHTIHLVHPHYVYAQLTNMQVMATLDDTMWKDPYRDAVKILAHLGFLYQDGVVQDD